MKRHEVFFFPNGNTGVFSNDKQDTDVQESWLLLFAEHMRNCGRDPLLYLFHLPTGKVAQLFETPEGLNWRIDDQI